MTTDVEARKQSVREAEARASSAEDWIVAARSWCDVDSGDEARRCVRLAIARDDADSTTFINGAYVANRLQDPAFARELLEGSVEARPSRPYKAQDWRSLAHYYRTFCDDKPTGRKRLDLGMSKMQNLDAVELCTFTLAYNEMDDPETARSLLARAEAAAGSEHWEELLRANVELGNPARAAQLIGDQLAAADTVKRCIDLAQIAERRKMTDFVRTALEQAERMAAQSQRPGLASDLMRVAERYRALLGDIDAVRRCVDRARPEQSNESQRAEITHAYRVWLGDRDAAEAPSPWQPPSKFLPLRDGQQLDGWKADRAALFEWLRPQLTQKGLETLAGSWRGDENMALLTEIQATGLLPHPHLFTRLRLRLNDGEGDHVVRAFAATLECLHSTFLEMTLPVLIDSCRALGAEALDAAVGLLVAVHEGYSDLQLRTSRARLALLIARAAGDPSDARLPALCKQLLAEPKLRAFTLRESAWQRLAHDVLVGEPHLAQVGAYIGP